MHILELRWVWSAYSVLQLQAQMSVRFWNIETLKDDLLKLFQVLNLEVILLVFVLNVVVLLLVKSSDQGHGCTDYSHWLLHYIVDHKSGRLAQDECCLAVLVRISNHSWAAQYDDAELFEAIVKCPKLIKHILLNDGCRKSNAIWKLELRLSIRVAGKILVAIPVMRLQPKVKFTTLHLTIHRYEKTSLFLLLKIEIFFGSIFHIYHLQSK